MDISPKPVACLMPMIALSLSSARFLPVRSASTNCGVNPSNRSVYFRCHVAASLFRGNHDREHFMIYVIDNYRAPENRPLLQSTFAVRSEYGRVGKEWVSQCKSRG